MNFIVGCPRTGTTWMFELLGHHPDVKLVTGDNLGLGKPGMETGMFIPQLGFTDDQIHAAVDALGTDKMLLEKTPWHIYTRMRLYRAFPQAKVIFMHRGSLAVVASMMEKFAVAPVEGATNNTPYLSTAVWLACERLRPIWKMSGVHEVEYDDLFYRPKETLAGVLDYLGLSKEPMDEMLSRPCDAEKRIGTPDSWRKALSQDDVDVVHSMESHA